MQIIKVTFWLQMLKSPTFAAGIPQAFEYQFLFIRLSRFNILPNNIWFLKINIYLCTQIIYKSIKNE